MRIIDRMTINGEMLAYCVGDDIPTSFECKKISVEGRNFKVLKSGSAMAFCGRMNALMTLDVKSLEEIPLGIVEVLR